jgi:hypothetical protein
MTIPADLEPDSKGPSTHRDDPDAQAERTHINKLLSADDPSSTAHIAHHTCPILSARGRRTFPSGFGSR